MTTSTGSIDGTATSADGSTIGWTRVGSGPAVVQVDGALCWRGMGPSGPVSDALKGDFTVYTYDRRGRGTSTEAGPFDVQREIDDLAAVIAAAGGSAFVFGQSSGAALAARAAASGQDIGITKLALFEAPFVVDASRAPVPADIVRQMEQLDAEGKHGTAVKLFMRQVGVPAPFVFMMQFMPIWKKLKGVAPTLPYDFSAIGPLQQGHPLPQDLWTGATMPTLVLDGGKSPDWMRNAQRAWAEALPNAEYRTLPGQTHMLKAGAVAPVLTEFFRR